MVKGIQRRVKRYVEVIVDHKEDGSMIPLAVIWEDGRKFEITRVLDRRQAAALKVGGNGIRFYVEIQGKRTFLYYEQPSWFVEEKVWECPSSGSGE